MVAAKARGKYSPPLIRMAWFCDDANPLPLATGPPYRYCPRGLFPGFERWRLGVSDPSLISYIINVFQIRN